MKNKFKIMLILFTFLIVLNIVYADQTLLLCLSKGEQVRFSECNPDISDRTCGSNYGCPYCVTLTDSGVYCPANINTCNFLGLSCSSSTDTTLDHQAPVITIISPVENLIYDSRAVLFNINLNEIADLDYYDNINGRGRWSRLCRDCSSFNRKISLDEGFNDITIRARDPVGNEANKIITFYIDSVEPRIIGSYPRPNKYTNGEFIIKYREANLKNITLLINNQEKLIKTDCPASARNAECIFNVDLSEYNGQEVGYNFEVRDSINVMTLRNPIRVRVDTVFPVIDRDSLNLTIDKKYVTFDIGVTEDNFESMDYIDNSDLRATWKTLCPRLKYGKCTARKSFKSGEHSLTIAVIDKAGNSVATNINFNI